MSTEQEALKCADAVESAWHDMVGGPELLEAAAMLRKLVAEREEYRAAMRRVVEASKADFGHRQEAIDAAITDLRQRLEGTT